MSDDIFNTTLAYTKNPKLCRRTTLQEELIEAIAARLARMKSSECSDNCAGGESVSLADVSDTSVDENSVEKTLNDFQISDNEEKNYANLSFLKNKKLNSDMKEDEPSSSTINNEERAPDGCEDVVVNPSSQFQNEDQEIGKEKIKMKPKPRILPVKSTPSAENHSSLEADNHLTPSPRPSSVQKKHGHGEEKDGLGEETGTALCEDLEAHPAPAPLPRLNGRQLGAEREAFPEHLDPESPWITSLSSSLNESLGSSYSPVSGEKTFIKEQNEEFTENRNSLKSNENQENSFLIDFINTALEKSKESQMTTDELEEEKQKANLIMSDDLTVDPPLLKSQSMLIPTNATESAKKTIEDRIMKNKKSTNNRSSSASSRLRTSEFLKNSSSIKRTPPKTTSSQYLGPLTVWDQKASEKQYLEPDRADGIHTAVYQEWLEKKNICLQEKNRIKRIESEKLRIQNEQKKVAKREAALASFEAWKAMKEKEAKKITPQKSLENKNNKKTKEEKAARKVEAQQAFERWREKKKIEYLKEKNTKEKEYERAKKQKEEETVAEQSIDNRTAVGKWNEEKEAFFKEKEKDKTDEKIKEVKRAEKIDKDKQAINEYEKCLNPRITSLSSSLNESLGNSFSPGSGETTFTKDQNEEFTENRNSLKSNENQENSFLIDFINTALEKSKESQMTTDELEEEKQKANLIMSDDLTVDPPLLKSQSMLIPSNATESAKKTIEDRIMKNKKSTNNRASSASSRLRTSEFLKNSSSIKRTPPKTTSSQYLGPLTVWDQKPSQKQYLEPDRADDIRASVYQEWLEKKNIYLQEKNRIKRIESEKLRIQNEQKKVAKREAALASFEAWKAMKEKEAKKIAAQKSLEDKNNKKTEEENAARKVEAQQAFERWREKKKIEYLKEKNTKEKKYERAKKQKEEETVAEQSIDNRTAVGKWNEEKEAFFKEKEKDKTDEKIKEVKRAEKIDKDKQAINEYEKCLNPRITSLSSSLNESLGNSFSPGSGETTFIKDQNEEFTENSNSLKSNENQENSFLIDFISTALEKSKESQMTADELEEEKQKANLIMSDDLTVDPPLLKSQSMLIPSNATESAKKTIEDRIMKNKKSTNNRASSASSRLRTSEFLKNSSSIKRTPPKTTSSQYLGPWTVWDQKPSQKQYQEPDRADDIRAAVYQDWLENKNIYLQEKNRIKRIESEKLRIQNEQKKVAKREAASASFEAWKAMKEKEAKKIAAQKSLEDKNNKKTEEENAARKVEAQQAFEIWRKKKKIEYLKEKNKKKKEYERAKKQKEEETVAEQSIDNRTAVRKWNEEKEAFFKEKEKDKTDEKIKEVKRAEKIDKDKQAINEYEKCLNPRITSLSSSLNESLGKSFSPGSGEKTFTKDQNEEFTEIGNSLKSNENQENSFLIDFINTALEKSKESQMTTDELEEEKQKANLIMSDDLTVDPPLLKSQSMLIPSNATESAKKTIEDRIMKNKKSTNNRASSASSRLRTSEFLKNSSSIKRTPPKTTSSQYLGPLTVWDQKPSQKQYREPDRADDIRAAVYQEWLEKKKIYLQEKNRIKTIKSEKLRIQNEQKKVAKREAALASFEAWKAMKEKKAKKITPQKCLENKNNKKTKEENAARKVEAQQAFERWREKKIEYLKEKNKKEKEYERAKKQKEEETVAEQRKDNRTTVGKWNEEKEAFFKEKEKDKTDEKIKEVKRAEKIDKDKQAINEYEKCLEKKERQERIKQKHKKHHSFLENVALPPWSPPSRVVFLKRVLIILILILFLLFCY